MTLTVPINVAWMAIGFSVLIGVVFGLYPANKASKGTLTRSFFSYSQNFSEKGPVWKHFPHLHLF